VGWWQQFQGEEIDKTDDKTDAVQSTDISTTAVTTAQALHVKLAAHQQKRKPLVALTADENGLSYTVNASTLLDKLYQVDNCGPVKQSNLDSPPYSIFIGANNVLNWPHLAVENYCTVSTFPSTRGKQHFGVSVPFSETASNANNHSLK
jgi:hypothetical protein